MTWGDCFSCLYGSFENSTCLNLTRQGEDIFPCTRKQLDVFHYDFYAPQISWWLHFFPPQQILITTADALLDEELRVQVCSASNIFCGVSAISGKSMCKYATKDYMTCEIFSTCWVASTSNGCIRVFLTRASLVHCTCM